MQTKPYDIHERTFQFACNTVDLYKAVLMRDRIWQPLAVQFLRAGTSIGANLEEARAGQSKADFIAKCSVARKEAFESHYWMRLLLACKLAPKEQVQPLLMEAWELSAILTTIIRKARQSPNRG